MIWCNQTVPGRNACSPALNPRCKDEQACHVLFEIDEPDPINGATGAIVMHRRAENGDRARG